MKTKLTPIIKFIKEIVLFSFICAILAVFAMVLYYPKLEETIHNQIKKTILYSLKDREADLKRVSSKPRLIIVGGSNGCFGFNSESISEALNREVINTSLHAGLGLQFQIQFVTPYIRKGDIVLLTPEYEQFFGDAYYGEEALASLIIGLYPERFVHLTRKQQYEVGIGIVSLAKNNIKPLSNKTSDENDGTYAYKAINEYGDATNHYNKENVYFMALPAINESFNQKAIDGIVEFYDYCKNKEATVLFLPPVIQNASFKNLEPNIKMVDSHLARHNLNYIAPPLRYCLDDSLFYNSPYHCNYNGVKVRTSYFIEDVSKQLDIINSNN